MQTVRLGRTGLDVSVAGLGCGDKSRLGTSPGGDVSQAADLVRYAMDLGVTLPRRHSRRIYTAPRLKVLKVTEPPKRAGGVKVESAADLVTKPKTEAGVL